MEKHRRETEDLHTDIDMMKIDLDALLIGDDIGRNREQIVIPDKYEHNNSPDETDLRLIPADEDTRNRWKKYLPIKYWLPRYRWSEWFAIDLFDAITEVVMVSTQCMGYALFAGLQPINVLYAALMGHCL
eukprot:318136_1